MNAKIAVFIIAVALLVIVAGCVGQRGKLELSWTKKTIKSGEQVDLEVQAINTGSETIKEVKVHFAPDVSTKVKIYEDGVETTMITLDKDVTPSIAETRRKILKISGVTDSEESKYRIVVSLLNEKNKPLDRKVIYLTVEK